MTMTTFRAAESNAFPNRLTILLLLVAVPIVGCGEPPDTTNEELVERQGAVTSYIQKLTIPAYLGASDPGWARIKQAGSRAIWDVIANGPANGPPPPAPNLDTALKSQLISVQNAGIHVIGYVNFFFGRSSTDIGNDVHTWISDYLADGIFFDNAGRTAGQDDIAKWEYWVQHVNLARPTPQFAARPYAIFNIGTVGSNIATYVRCAYAFNGTVPGPKSKYVIAEMTHDVFMAGSTDALFQANSWINSYSPALFIQIPYKNPDPATWASFNVPNIMQKPEMRNSASFYVQDFTGTNTWGTLTSQATWNAMVQKVTTEGFLTFNGTAGNGNASGCPNAAP